MKHFSDRLLYALETELYAASLRPTSECEQIRDAIALCKKALGILKRFLTGYFFESLEEEIHFFKIVKPLFYSKYIYYIKVYNYYIKKPVGSEQVVSEFITTQLADLKNFFDHNHAFYQYYRSGSSHLDTCYFTRGNFDVYAEIEDFQGDEIFSTSHDYKISKVIANERYQEYLMLKCREINQDCTIKPDTPIVWTGSQSDLVELLYALVESRSFNDGDVQIKTLVLYFQNVFQIDLKYYYHKYTDISNRKKERTVFLDRLRTCLLEKMDSKHALKKPELRKIEFT